MAKLAGCAVLVLALAASMPAHAHKLKVFATADGATIEGRVYFVGGAASPGARITVEAPPGTRVATLAADDEGRFRFAAGTRADHVIVADAGDGHSARFTIAAADLPASLPTSAAATAPSADAADPEVADPGAVRGIDPLAPPATALRDMVAEAVASQVRPLREQLNAYEDQVRFRDIVGGIGYILGLAGVALWLKAAGRPRAGR